MFTVSGKIETEMLVERIWSEIYKERWVPLSIKEVTRCITIHYKYANQKTQR